MRIAKGMAVTKTVTEIGFWAERAQKETHASIAQGRKIIVMEPGKIIKDDLVQDIIEV
ncbi:hypothetical protein M1N11_01670 [Peptococcaceae bacterium]|nr:hypothetical protein [Peptococcaceae bacterium]